jgi:hypothetical protein
MTFWRGALQINPQRVYRLGRDKLETMRGFWLKLAAHSKNYFSFKSLRTLFERPYKKIVTSVILIS